MGLIFIPRPICFDCDHFRSGRQGQSRFGMTCDAFTHYIPEEIIKGEVAHDKPYPGDKGIQFKRRADAKAV